MPFIQSSGSDDRPVTLRDRYYQRFEAEVFAARRVLNTPPVVSISDDPPHRLQINNVFTFTSRVVPPLGEVGGRANLEPDLAVFAGGHASYEKTYPEREEDNEQLTKNAGRFWRGG